jgi:hypothetical protein
MKYVRFKATVIEISTKTKLVSLADVGNTYTNEYSYSPAVEPLLIEAIKENAEINVFGVEEKEGTHITITEVEPFSQPL